MNRFFKPEDFEDASVNSMYHLDKLHIRTFLVEMAARANAKLEREGKVVEVELGYIGQGFNSNIFRSSTISKALLISIEAIEPCMHPKEKIKPFIDCERPAGINVVLMQDQYICECGVKVKPKEFEEV